MDLTARAWAALPSAGGRSSRVGPMLRSGGNPPPKHLFTVRPYRRLATNIMGREQLEVCRRNPASPRLDCITRKHSGRIAGLGFAGYVTYSFGPTGLNGLFRSVRLGYLPGRIQRQPGRPGAGLVTTKSEFVGLLMRVRANQIQASRTVTTDEQALQHGFRHNVSRPAVGRFRLYHHLRRLRLTDRVQAILRTQIITATRKSSPIQGQVRNPNS